MKHDKPEWCQRRIFLSQYLGLCLTEGAFYSALRHLKLPASDRPAWKHDSGANATTHFLIQRGKRGRAAIVALHDWPERSNVEVFGLLVHEAVHLWKDELRHLRETNPGEETECYGIQAIAQNLFEAFEKQTKRSRR